MQQRFKEGDTVCDACDRRYHGTIKKVGPQVSEIKWAADTPGWLSAQSFVQNKFIWPWPVPEGVKNVAAPKSESVQAVEGPPAGNAKAAARTEGPAGRRPTPKTVRASDDATAPKNVAIGLLRRPQGCTVAELVAATGWQPHSASAFVSIQKRDPKLKVTRVDGVCRIEDA